MEARSCTTTTAPSTRVPVTSRAVSGGKSTSSSFGYCEGTRGGQPAETGEQPEERRHGRWILGGCAGMASHDSTTTTTTTTTTSSSSSTRCAPRTCESQAMAMEAGREAEAGGEVEAGRQAGSAGRECRQGGRSAPARARRWRRRGRQSPAGSRRGSSRGRGARRPSPPPWRWWCS